MLFVFRDKAAGAGKLVPNAPESVYLALEIPNLLGYPAYVTHYFGILIRAGRWWWNVTHGEDVKLT